MREIEHVVLNPDAHDCPFESDVGIPCGCDWHVDGGIRGYKLWLPIQKARRNQTNILVAPMSHAQRLCELAGEIANAHADAHANAADGGAQDGAQDGGAQDGAWQMTTDSNGARGWRLESGGELTARRRDRLALEAVGCTIHAEAGDLLLFFPGIYHRTQDVLDHRVSIIAEATHA